MRKKNKINAGRAYIGANIVIISNKTELLHNFNLSNDNVEYDLNTYHMSLNII